MISRRSFLRAFAALPMVSFGEFRYTQESLVARIAPVSPQLNHGLADIYKTECDLSEIDWVLAYSQSAHETGNFKSWWFKEPRNNVAGLGVSGKWSRIPRKGYVKHENGLYYKGMVFDTLEDAVRTHVGYLVYYCHSKPNDYACSIIEKYTTVSLKNTGKYPTLQMLGRKWAVPGLGYGKRIARIANSFLEKI